MEDQPQYGKPDRTKPYIGAKIIRAEPMDRETFHLTIRGFPSLDANPGGVPTPGYKVMYPDGYVSWSPKETFETAYREVTRGEIGLLR